MKIFDISQEVLSCSVYEGDPAPKTEKIMDMKKGESYNLSSLSMCAHNGTHIDAPRHFFADGKSIDEMGLEHFVGDCYVAVASGEISSRAAIGIIERAKCAGAHRRILIKGDATLREDAARVFASAEVLLLGVESQSVGPVDSPMAVHKILLSSNVALLEGAVLSEVEEGRYFLSCAPLNIAGIEGSPTRAILIKQ